MPRDDAGGSAGDLRIRCCPLGLGLQRRKGLDGRPPTRVDSTRGTPPRTAEEACARNQHGHARREPDRRFMGEQVTGGNEGCRAAGAPSYRPAQTDAASV